MKYVFFDLDGTLTDPGEGITNSIAYAIEKMGEKAPTCESLYKYIGPPLIEMFMEDRGYSRDDAVRALGYYREYFTTKGIYENRVYDGVPEMLEAVKKSGLGVVLATSKPQPFAETILNHFDLMKYFDYVCGSTLDETRTKKHEVIEYALSELEITPNDAVMVGDRKHDVDGAHKTGLKAIGVLYGYGSRDELEKAGADKIAETVEELKLLLTNL